jgi:hypothetical protein
MLVAEESLSASPLAATIPKVLVAPDGSVESWVVAKETLDPAE